MLEALLSALATVVSGANIIYLLGGVVLGVTVGILPGLGGTAGMALLLPFVYGMEPTAALTMMIGLLGVVATGDTFTSVIMGVPGSAGSQATVLDGFPMARRGEGARALGAAFFASMLGGIVGAIVLTGAVQVARPIVLAFGAAELLMLSVFGLGLVGVLSGNSLPKGIAGCGLGLLLGAVGAAPATGHFRMTFGTLYLSEGLSIALVALGLFALPEVVYLLKGGGSIASETKIGSGQWQGIKDVIRHRWIMFRCAMIGCTVGAIPGLGGAVIDWLAYGHVVQTSRDKSMFGKGDIRGVIASETSNNAKDGGALIPTLIFGIPGSGGTAVLLGGLMLIGMTPGPKMLEGGIETVYVIIWSLALANVIGAAICFGIAGPLSRLTHLPYAWIAPFMIVIIMFGAYQTTRDWADLVTLIAIGIFAILMKRYGWPRPPLLIGFVLASGIEINLYQSVQFYGMSWLGHPIVVVLLILTAVSLWFGVRNRIQTELEDEGAPNSRIGNVAFSLFVAGLAALAIVNTAPLPFLGNVFPLTVAVLVLPLTLWVAWDAMRSTGAYAPLDLRAAVRNPDVRFLAWIIGFLLLGALIGFLPAVAVFVAAFLMMEGNCRWAWSLLAAVLTVGGVYLLGRLLVIKFPEGLIAWPF